MKKFFTNKIQKSLRNQFETYLKVTAIITAINMNSHYTMKQRTHLEPPLMHITTESLRNTALAK